MKSIIGDGISDVCSETMNGIPQFIFFVCVVYMLSSVSASAYTTAVAAILVKEANTRGAMAENAVHP